MNKIWNFSNAANKHLLNYDKSECPFCKEILSNLFTEKLKGTIHNEDFDDLNCIVCQTCGWWKLERETGIWGTYADGLGQRYTGEKSGLSATLKNLDLSDLTLPLKEVKSFLVAKYENRFSINPRLFEETVGSVFADLGYQVAVTAYSNDGGIDVILHKHNKEIGVQVKRYKNKIGVSQIRELIGALVHNRLTQGIFITTSDFEKGAYQMYEDFKSPGYPIQPVELINAKKFLELLKITQRGVYQSKEDFFEGKEIDINRMTKFFGVDGY